MLKVKGIYRNGIVELLEPVEAPEAIEVEVGFPIGEQYLMEAKPHATAIAAFEGIVGLYNELTPEQQHLFDEAIQRSPDFFSSERELTWDEPEIT